MGGFEVVQHKMRGTTFGLGLSAVGLFIWDIMRPETLMDVNMVPSMVLHHARQRSKWSWLA